jgi:3-deoxy-manno-octulosonate cytidylyltransferase (CMP-KDO synthetase)
MIWWVYQQALQVPEFDQVYVATDSINISLVLAELSIPFIITSDRHPNHIGRIHAMSEIISADFYVCINGDEPLVDPFSIQAGVSSAKMSENPCFYGAMRTLTSPAQTIDDAKIKLAIAANGRCIYLSRAPIPHPQGTLLFDYKKYMGIANEDVIEKLSVILPEQFKAWTETGMTE